MKGFRICRIFGIDIEIDLTMIFLLALIAWSLTSSLIRQLPQLHPGMYWFAAIFMAIIFMFSILFHELAHSLVAKKMSMIIKRISLFMFGGAAHIEDKDGFNSPKSEFFISAVGPVSSIFLAGIFYALAILIQPSSAWHKLFISAFGWLGYINVILAVFNAIPAFPMDGGRIFRAICWWRMKNLVKATKTAVNVSIILLFLLPIGTYFLWGWFSALWIVFICFFYLIPMARAEYLAVREQYNKNSRL